ncbi:MAG TPA: WYL domain-containing protein [Planctomycetota bacterium]|nr:WYL domain-containing protein [Planctomycetota bacterium]
MARTSAVFRLDQALRIHQIIARGRYPNASTLARELNASVKTVRGYMRLLADTFQIELHYDPRRKGFYYSGDAGARLTPFLSEDEVVAVFLLDEAARAMAGTPVQEVLNSAQRKFAMMVPARYQLSLDDIAASFSIRRSRAADTPSLTATLQTLFKAARAEQRIECVYRSRTRKKPTRRKLDPLHLTQAEGTYYLIAYCHLRKGIRTFVPARMSELKLLDEYFDRPENFNAEEHFRTAFGIVAGVNVRPVSLRFTPKVAQLIRERRWHATQVLDDLPSGEVRLRMTCSQGEELLAWLMSWGKDVKVEEPGELRERVRGEHEGAAK